jgi:hypothetical protein
MVGQSNTPHSHNYVMLIDCGTDMCYSLISRSRDRRNQKEAEKYRRDSFPTYYASKSVIEWSRMNVWACHDLINHTITALVVRCPDHLMTAFVSTFSGQQGTVLLQHPTLMHAYFCSDYLSHSYDFLGAFSEDTNDLVSAIIDILVNRIRTVVGTGKRR